VPTASATNRGALSSADWSTFNSKQQALNGTGFVKISGTTISYDNSTYLTTSAAASTYLPLTGGTLTGLLTVNSSVISTTSFGGTFTASDGTNQVLLGSYQNTIGSGNSFDGVIYTTNASSALFILTGGSTTPKLTIASTGAATISNLAGSGTRMVVADANGVLSTQTITVGTVTAVTASSPLASSGGTTPNITIQQASGSQNGFLSSTDWTTFNNKQNALTNPVTGTGTTNYLPKFTGSTTVGNSNLINDSSGNLGLGVTPSAWFSAYKVIQVGNTASFFGVGSQAYIGNNTFVNSSDNFAYITSNSATLYRQNTGIHYWYNAPSGTAGNAITFTQAMTLFSSGNLAVGPTTDAGFKLDVNGTGRFSDTVSITANNSNAYSLNLLGRSADNATTLNFFSNNGATRYGFIYTEPTKMEFGVNGSVRLTIASTGAATFSSTLQTVGDISLMNASGDIHIRMKDSSGNADRVLLRQATTNDVYVGDIDANNGRLIIRTNGNNAVTIASGGNVMIGTETDSGFKLEVQGGLPIVRAIDSNTSGANRVAGFRAQTNTSLGDFLSIANNANAPFNSNDGVYIMNRTSGSSLYFTTNNGGTEAKRLTINSSGNVLIGTTTDSGGKLQVSGETFLSGRTGINSTPVSGVVLSIKTENNGSADFGLVIRNSSDSNLFRVRNDGSVILSSLGTGLVYSNGGILTSTNPSDFKLKENILPINYGLSEILKLNAVTFNWKNDVINQGKQYGFIAQEVQKIMPDLVKQGDYLGLDKDGIFTTLVKAIQELNDKIK
jgi:hypothetical protein